MTAPRFNARRKYFSPAPILTRIRIGAAGANRIAGMTRACHDVAKSTTYCPMKRLAIPILTVALALAAPAHAQFAPQTKANANADAPRPLGYDRVADALAALQKRPDARITHPDNWTVVTISKPELAVWSFVPKEHDAYPSVVRRLIRKSDKGTFVEMKVLCEAKQDACRKLALQFQQMTAQMQQALQAKGAQH